MDNRVSKFKEIFFGLDRAYGQFTAIEDQREDGKELGETKFVKSPVTDSLWQSHLEGAWPSLGIVPINDDFKCKWGCIDVDTYPLDHLALVKKLKSKGLPFIVARSKSGGAHVFLFFKEYISAKVVVDKLKELASGLGYSDCEVFPKQIKLDTDRGDCGSFLNLPYFNGLKYSSRVAYDDQGNAMSLDQFLEEVEKKKLTVDELKKLKITKQDSPFADAPFCIESYLAENGTVQEGSRDNFLFQYAVYAKKKYGETFEEEVYNFHHQYFDKPLPPAQIQKIIKQSDKKDWGYKCKDQPMCSFCNKSKCRIRKYGIGEDNVLTDIGSVVQFGDGDDTIYHLNINDFRITLTIDELYDQHKFRKKCLAKSGSMPPVLKREDYDAFIINLVGSADKVVSDYELTPEGQFNNILSRFISTQANATDIDEIIAGSCFVDEEDNKVYFRTDQLQEYMKNRKHAPLTANQIGVFLRALGGTTAKKKLNGKHGQLVWVLDNGKFNPKIEPITQPQSEETEEVIPF